MIRLEKINEENFYKIVKMKVSADQEKFVATNVYSLAQAWLYSSFARPFAIMNKEEPVSFLMMGWEEEKRTASIWRFMIEENN